MLIDYSIRSFEILGRKLTDVEKAETFSVFNRVGLRMGIRGLPATYKEWLVMRQEHLEKDLIRSDFTIHLYKQYRKHLGLVRYELLKQAQGLVVPEKVKELLSFKTILLISTLLRVYKFTRLFKLEVILKNLILPGNYKKQVYGLDVMK